MHGFPSPMRHLHQSSWTFIADHKIPLPDPGIPSPGHGFPCQIMNSAPGGGNPVMLNGIPTTFVEHASPGMKIHDPGRSLQFLYVSCEVPPVPCKLSQVPCKFPQVPCKLPQVTPSYLADRTVGFVGARERELPCRSQGTCL